MLVIALSFQIFVKFNEIDFYIFFHVWFWRGEGGYTVVVGDRLALAYVSSLSLFPAIYGQCG